MEGDGDGRGWGWKMLDKDVIWVIKQGISPCYGNWVQILESKNLGLNDFINALLIEEKIKN